jgi:hypothetical protein
VAKNKDRVILSQCVGKVMAYLRVDRKEEARQWADKLVRQLRKMDLLPLERPDGG